MSRVIVFDVEHGFCAFVKSPTGRTLMIDCGRKAKFSPAIYVLQNELGGTRLTELVVSHPHDDHIEDVETISSRVEPEILYRQQYDWEQVKQAEGDYENLDRYRIWQQTYNAPAPVRDWGMAITIFRLTPVEAYAINPNNYINNSGVVVVVTITGTQFSEKFVFGADVETDGWDALLLKPGFRAAVANTHFFIVPHHGHCSGFSTALYEAMGRPILNLVSVRSGDDDVDSRYGSAEYARGLVMGSERRYSVTTRTDGSIFIDVDESGRFLIYTRDLADNDPLAAAVAAFLGGMR